MKYLGKLLGTALASLLLAALPVVIVAAVAGAPALSVPSALAIAEIKITGDEFVMIQNNSQANIPDLSQYWLESYNNVNPLATGATNASQQLPAVSLGEGQTVSLSAVARPTCGSSVAGKLNLSLTDGGGYLQIVHMQATATGSISHLPGDSVSWSSSASAGQISSVPSSSKDPLGLYYRYQMNGSAYGWQLADQDIANPCQLNVTITGATTSQQTPSLSGLLVASDSAPSKIISLSDAATSLPGEFDLPAADEGLIIPEITEVLPNPMGTGNDATEEFIELYNPNDQTFDLSNFQLRVGTTTVHTYIFPDGTTLPGKAFSAYFAAATGLGLSNTAGRVSLHDPAGNELIATDNYGTAKDGQSWALANGKWYWTSSVTPAAANIIVQPITTVTKAVATSATKAAATAKAAKTTKAKTATTKAAKTKNPKATKAAAGLAASSAALSLPNRPIHTSVLALIAGAALLYGAYEYRTDVSNYLHKLRRQFTARRSNRL